MRSFFYLLIAGAIIVSCKDQNPREVLDFDNEWKFQLGDQIGVQDSTFNDASWRALALPHDWSIEGTFDEKNPSGTGGGALPGGIGWYRKTFRLAKEDTEKKIFIEFDGVYRNSEVWINNHYLGKRPYGYISFQYELTPFLNFNQNKNVLTVKVDNSQQPNSRWYSGAGIYRDVKLIKTGNVFIEYNGTVITASGITDESSTINFSAKVKNDLKEDQSAEIVTTLFDPTGKMVANSKSTVVVKRDSVALVAQSFNIEKPLRWDIETPRLYKAVTVVEVSGKKQDEYETPFGLREFSFDREQGFFLNGKSLKINGVCLHHDLGCLGAAFNERAAERQLEIMKSMGVNAIRTSHNPPAPAFLDLCDKMGFIVMDEFVDMWRRKKTEFDYSRDFEEWHKKDLSDFIIRDRNHPSVMIWSVGNEIGEQWDSTGISIAKRLVSIVKDLDPTRPVATANNELNNNFIIKSDRFDLIGYNYAHQRYKDFLKDFPGKKFIATETVSGLATRGYYDMPSDSMRHWPIRWDLAFTQGNPGNTVSAYDNVCAPWGSTNEETLKEIKKYKFLSGQFIWTGFDYIGEPTPYLWPSRSSYFGIVDLAGFPKDVYYMYQSEWTSQPVLHVFPHWNWKPGQVIDVLAYYNNGDEVELFLNEKSLGKRQKQADDLHVMWRVPFQPGKLHAVVRKDGKEVMTKDVVTAAEVNQIVLEPDRHEINASGKDLSFVKVMALDKNGALVPNANDQIDFEIEGEGFIAGVDNGDQTSHDSFKSKECKFFNGLALVVVQGKNVKGTIKLKASVKGLSAGTTTITVQ